jgi:LuxR family maltose regulon positive regulatory protein
MLNRSLQGIWQYPLTVVEAPMGYGKTTAVREFLKGCDAKALWQTVFATAASDFWQGFCRLFAELDPACGAALAGLIGSIKFPEGTVIVIDDYHLVASRNIDCFFERLAQAKIPGLHIVIISCCMFGENKVELALKGYCLILGRKHFELTEDEITEYCRMCGVRLKAEDAAFLYTYSEGWISAVYLCILGYRQSGRLEQQTASLHELINEVVYQPCSPEMKEFLTTICIFDCFSLAQAEYMWRRGNAGELLARLTAENAFISFDYVGGIYYMHNILTGFLRLVLDRQGPERRRALWKSAGEWYFDAGDYGRAMDSFYQAADFDSLLSAIEASGNSYAKHPMWPTGPKPATPPPMAN